MSTPCREACTAPRPDAPYPVNGLVVRLFPDIRAIEREYFLASLLSLRAGEPPFQIFGEPIPGLGDDPHGLPCCR